MLSVEIPMPLPSVANMREHWRVAAQRARSQRSVVCIVLVLKARPLGIPKLPVAVTLTRVASRVLDGDNWARAAKHVRDGVADFLGVDDGDDRVRWSYRQEKATKSRYQGLIVEVREVGKPEHVAAMADEVF